MLDRLAGQLLCIFDGLLHFHLFTITQHQIALSGKLPHLFHSLAWPLLPEFLP
jgi:hypothetical protein